MSVNDYVRRLLGRRRAYRMTFLADDGKPHRHAEIVLADLKRFCRATNSTAAVSPKSGTIDPIAMGIAEGRREMFNRIQAHLYLDDRTIQQLSESEE